MDGPIAVLTPPLLEDEYVERNLREPTKDTETVIYHNSLERGSITLYLPAGVGFEFKNDDPTKTRIASVPEDADPTDIAEYLQSQ